VTTRDVSRLSGSTAQHARLFCSTPADT